MSRMTNATTRDDIEQMTHDKWTPREIAKLLDISTQTVYYHLRRLDLEPSQRGERR